MSTDANLNAEEQKIAELTEKLFASGGTLKDIKGFDDKAMESVYTAAFQLYQNGKYDDAREAFRFLVFFDHYEIRYLMGLGACEQMLHNYSRAIECYSHVGVLTGMNDPLPPLHAAECHLALGDLEEAASGFRYAHGLAAAQPGQQALAERTRGLLELVEKRLQSDDSPANTSER